MKSDKQTTMSVCQTASDLKNVSSSDHTDDKNDKKNEK